MLAYFNVFLHKLHNTTNYQEKNFNMLTSIDVYCLKLLFYKF